MFNSPPWGHPGPYNQPWGKKQMATMLIIYRAGQAEGKRRIVQYSIWKTWTINKHNTQLQNFLQIHPLPLDDHYTCVETTLSQKGKCTHHHKLLEEQHSTTVCSCEAVLLLYCFKFSILCKKCKVAGDCSIPHLIIW